MGMHDKDKEIGLVLQSYVDRGAEFILWDAKVIREDFPTKLGPSAQAELTISKSVDDAAGRHQVKVTTLASAIVAKVREAEPSDFPAVMFWNVVPSNKWGTDATVIQYVRDLRPSPSEGEAA